MKNNSTKGGNMYDTRESWLRAATYEVSPLFEACGFSLPEKIRHAIAFTSTGKRGHIPGECWHPSSSADGHFEIIIRADICNPVDVLCVLVHELCHTLLPPEIKHGKEFKDIAQRIGLEGKMRQATPSSLLRERLNAIAAILGPLPHAKLDFLASSDVPRKQATRLLKAECGASCGYTIRIAAKWARAGLPLCPVDADHGILKCDIPDNDGDDNVTGRIVQVNLAGEA